MISAPTDHVAFLTSGKVSQQTAAETMLGSLPAADVQAEANHPTALEPPTSDVAIHASVEVERPAVLGNLAFVFRGNVECSFSFLWQEIRRIRNFAKE